MSVLATHAPAVILFVRHISDSCQCCGSSHSVSADTAFYATAGIAMYDNMYALLQFWPTVLSAFVVSATAHVRSQLLSDHRSIYLADNGICMSSLIQ